MLGKCCGKEGREGEEEAGSERIGMGECPALPPEHTADAHGRGEAHVNAGVGGAAQESDHFGNRMILWLC